MLLYRGDRYDRANSMAGLFRTDGIITKLASNYAPAYVANPALQAAARAHIAAGSAIERAYQHTSNFLSFSAERGIALTYAAGLQGDSLLPSPPYQENAVVFVLNTEGLRAAGHQGVWLLDYDCNYMRAQPPSEDDVAVFTAAAVQCELCFPIGGIAARRTHRLMLLDAAEFLASSPASARSATALVSAQRDREWLVVPLDYIPRLEGFAARIPLSNIWDTELFQARPSQEGP